MDPQQRRESVHRRDSIPVSSSSAIPTAAVPPPYRRESIQPASSNTPADVQSHRRESIQPGSPLTAAEAPSHRRESLLPSSPNTSPAPPPTPVVQSGIGSSPQHHQTEKGSDDDEDDGFSVTDSYVPDSNASESNLTTFDQASNASELSVLLDRPQHVISLHARGSVSGAGQPSLRSAESAVGQQGKGGNNHEDLSPHGPPSERSPLHQAQTAESQPRHQQLEPRQQQQQKGTFHDPFTASGNPLPEPQQQQGTFYDPFAPVETTASRHSSIIDWTVDHTQGLANRARESFRKTSSIIDPEVVAQLNLKAHEAVPEEESSGENSPDEQFLVPSTEVQWQSRSRNYHSVALALQHPSSPTPSSRPPTPPPKDLTDTPTRQGPFCYSPDARRQISASKKLGTRSQAKLTEKHSRSHSEPQVPSQPLWKLARQLSLPVLDNPPPSQQQQQQSKQKQQSQQQPQQQQQPQRRKSRASFLGRCNTVLRESVAALEPKSIAVKEKLAAALHRTQVQSSGKNVELHRSYPQHSDLPAAPEHLKLTRKQSLRRSSSGANTLAFIHRPWLQRPPALLVPLPCQYNLSTQLETVRSEHEDYLPSSPSFDLPSPLLLPNLPTLNKPVFEEPPEHNSTTHCQLFSKPARHTPSQLHNSKSFGRYQTAHGRPYHHSHLGSDVFAMATTQSPSRPSTSTGLPLRTQRSQWTGVAPSTTSYRPLQFESQPGFYDPRTRDRSTSRDSTHASQDFGFRQGIVDDSSAEWSSSRPAVSQHGNMLDLADDEDCDASEEEGSLFDEPNFHRRAYGHESRGNANRFSFSPQYQQGDDLPGAKARRVLGLNKDAGWEIGDGATDARFPPTEKAPTSFRSFTRLGNFGRARGRGHTEGDDQDGSPKPRRLTQQRKAGKGAADFKRSKAFDDVSTTGKTSSPAPLRRSNSMVSTRSAEQASLRQSTDFCSGAGLVNDPHAAAVPEPKLSRRLSGSSSERSATGDTSSITSSTKKKHVILVAPWLERLDSHDVSSGPQRSTNNRWWKSNDKDNKSIETVDTALRTSSALGLSSPVSADSLARSTSRDSSRDLSNQAVHVGVPSSRSLDFGSSSAAPLPLRTSHSTDIPVLLASGASSESGSRESNFTRASSKFTSSGGPVPRSSKALARVTMSPSLPLSSGSSASGAVASTRPERRRFDGMRKRLLNNGRNATPEIDSADRLASHVSLREKMLWERQLERSEQDACWQSMIEHRPRNRQVSSNATLESANRTTPKTSLDSASSTSSMFTSYRGSDRMLGEEASPGSEYPMTTTAATTPRSMATTVTPASSSGDEWHDERARQDYKGKADKSPAAEKLYTGPSIEHLSFGQYQDSISAGWSAWAESVRSFDREDEVELLEERPKRSRSRREMRPQVLRAHSDDDLTKQKLMSGRRGWPAPGARTMPEPESQAPRLPASATEDSIDSSDTGSFALWRDAFAPSVDDASKESPNVEGLIHRTPSDCSNGTVRGGSQTSLPLWIDGHRRGSDFSDRFEGLSVSSDGGVSFGSEVEKAMAEEEVVDPMGAVEHTTPRRRWQQTTSMCSQETEEVLATDGEDDIGEGSCDKRGLATRRSGDSYPDEGSSYSYTQDGSYSHDSTSTICPGEAEGEGDEEGTFVILPPSPSNSFLSLNNNKKGEQYYPVRMDMPTPPKRLRDWPSEGCEDGEEQEEEEDEEQQYRSRGARYVVQPGALCI